MEKWEAEPWVCWRNPLSKAGADPLQISLLQLSDITNRAPGRSLWRLLKVQKCRGKCYTFVGAGCVLVHFGSRSCRRWGMLRDRCLLVAPFPWTRVWPALEPTEWLRVAHLLDKQGKQTPWCKEPCLLLGFSRGRLWQALQRKNSVCKIWQKQLLITHGPFPSQALGLTVWVLWRVTYLQDNVSHWFWSCHGTQGCISTNVSTLGFT